MPETVVLERQNAVARISIARTESGNALRGDDVLLLGRHFRNCLTDPNTRVIVITGQGTKFFCTGGDISELSGNLADIGVHIAKWHELLDLMEASVKPVIAAINGIAVGGGLELALACHQRFAAKTARVGLPELNVGLFPAAGGIRRLTRLIGRAKTLRLVLSADMPAAEVAERLGIVDQVCDAANLQSVVQTVADRYSALEPNAVRATLTIAHHAARGTDTNELETSLLRECYATPRNREILSNFMSRQKARADKS